MPLSFRAIRDFLPRYDVHKRLAVYAILGGVPAYLERWDNQETIVTNVERLFLQRTGWFRTEPLVLIGDLTQRETTNFEAILKAMAAGRHSREDIAAATAITPSSLGHYLPRLMELRLVERRIPATVPLPQRSVSKLSRYHLADPYLRFYYRFIDPNLHLIEQGLAGRLWEKVANDFRAFVAGTFEELCRAWVLSRARAGALPFIPDVIGSHWAADAQRSPALAGVDVVAINWETKAILLGEAKWGEGLVGREVIRDLAEKTGRVVPGGGADWTIHYAFFARAGFTDEAHKESAHLGARLLTLEEMEAGL